MTADVGGHGREAGGVGEVGVLDDVGSVVHDLADHGTLPVIEFPVGLDFFDEDLFVFGAQIEVFVFSGLAGFDVVEEFGAAPFGEQAGALHVNVAVADEEVFIMDNDRHGLTAVGKSHGTANDHGFTFTQGIASGVSSRTVDVDAPGSVEPAVKSSLNTFVFDSAFFHDSLL